ncbi:DUF1211 domain-containing protein [Ktedonosporobacter rubrisoli]|uniref:DUF1211 domain-containing protein n=1 Tax=Ktedonosporobacter rubrisoli TaxID=2509675 RepID=A0A4P6JMX6_KTERU|nr:TMEM175 family protein [Ktedonosporobacter rubrisoli]QBD76604.1 DUF1211 domain-containing protein [Ktedonosporobacter rubrisoli]
MSRPIRPPLESLFGKPVQEEHSPGEDRLVMLCDGVFAIAITLLVLDIKLPPIPAHIADPAGFVHNNIMGLLPKIVIYLITFFLLAQLWQDHRTMMRYIQRLDKVFISLTFLFLAFIVFFPVAFNIAAEYSDFPEGVVFYTLSLIGCGCSAQLLWLYASWRHRLTGPETNSTLIASRSIHSLIVPVYFCLSLLLLLIPSFHDQPSKVYWSWIFLPIFAVFIGRILHRFFPALEVPPADKAQNLPSEESNKDDEKYQKIEQQ